MNVFLDICTPILEGLSSGIALNLVVPTLSYQDAAYDPEDDLQHDCASGYELNFNKPNGCKMYAQVLAIIAIIVELKSGE